VKPNSAAATDGLWFLVIFGSAFLLRLLYLNQVESIPLFSFAEYLAACGEDEGEENPP